MNKFYLVNYDDQNRIWFGSKENVGCRIMNVTSTDRSVYIREAFQSEVLEYIMRQIEENICDSARIQRYLNMYREVYG